jgi:hypothetical protein
VRRHISLCAIWQGLSIPDGLLGWDLIAFSLSHMIIEGEPAMGALSEFSEWVKSALPARKDEESKLPLDLPGPLVEYDPNDTPLDRLKKIVKATGGVEYDPNDTPLDRLKKIVKATGGVEYDPNETPTDRLKKLLKSLGAEEVDPATGQKVKRAVSDTVQGVEDKVSDLVQGVKDTVSGVIQDVEQQVETDPTVLVNQASPDVGSDIPDASVSDPDAGGASGVEGDGGAPPDSPAACVQPADPPAADTSASPADSAPQPADQSTDADSGGPSEAPADSSDGSTPAPAAQPDDGGDHGGS